MVNNVEELLRLVQVCFSQVKRILKLKYFLLYKCFALKSEFLFSNKKNHDILPGLCFILSAVIMIRI